MTQTQTALVIREAIRQAAAKIGVKPSEAHNPPANNRQAVAAQRIAMRLAYDQGVTRKEIAEGFRRSVKVVGNALALTKD